MYWKTYLNCNYKRKHVLNTSVIIINNVLLLKMSYTSSVQDNYKLQTNYIAMTMLVVCLN